MLVEEEIKKVLDELVDTEYATIELGGSSIAIQVFENGSKMFLSTPVYLGGNYIPKSVRGCLEKKAPFDNLNIQTSLKVEEESFQIYLNYVGHVEGLTTTRFVGLLEDYSWLAERWRDYLDDHDKKDLVHIHST